MRHRDQANDQGSTSFVASAKIKPRGAQCHDEKIEIWQCLHSYSHRTRRRDPAAASAPPPWLQKRSTPGKPGDARDCVLLGQSNIVLLKKHRCFRSWTFPQPAPRYKQRINNTIQQRSALSTSHAVTNTEANSMNFQNFHHFQNMASNIAVDIFSWQKNIDSMPATDGNTDKNEKRFTRMTRISSGAPI